MARVALTNCVLTNCYVQGGIGGGSAPGGRGAGGAIYNLDGRLILNNYKLSENFARGGAGNADIPTLLLSAQRGSGAGGAIFSEGGDFEVHGTIFFANGATGGPAWAGAGSETRGGHGAGGALALRNGRLQTSLSEFRDNSASGANAFASGQLAGDAHGGAILIETNGVGLVEQSIFAGNWVTSGNSTATQNVTYARGGAVFSAGSLQLRKTTVDQNTASTGSNTLAGTALGGGIASLGSFVLDSSTVSSNSAQGWAAQGGGLFCQGGSLLSTNSTLAFNSATGQGQGGAIMLLSNSAIVLNATVAYNTGGGIDHQNSSFRLRNSIVSSNAPVNFTGLVIDDGYNISSDSSVLLLGMGSTNNVDPRLAQLSTNGGPTRTIALLANSPARDFVPPNLSPSVDQRGTTRAANTRGDAGAFEVGVDEAPPLIVTMPVGGTVRFGSNFTFQVVALGNAFSYSWLSNGIALPNATNNLLALTNILVLEPFVDYHAVVSNRFGAVTSSVAKLTIDAKPRIDVEPADILVAPANPASFTVTASGPALTYFWHHDGFRVPDAADRTLSFTNASPAVSGAYTVIVTNNFGSVTKQDGATHL